MDIKLKLNKLVNESRSRSENEMSILNSLQSDLGRVKAIEEQNFDIKKTLDAEKNCMDRLSFWWHREREGDKFKTDIVTNFDLSNDVVIEILTMTYMDNLSKIDDILSKYK